MKRVYSNENHFLVNNAKTLIDAQGINTFIKNEFAQGAVGETSPFDAWLEVWVTNDGDFEQALNILKTSNSSKEGKDWVCRSCSEENAPSFEVCWNCQSENT
jgi:hypothetical protein